VTLVATGGLAVLAASLAVPRLHAQFDDHLRATASGLAEDLHVGVDRHGKVLGVKPDLQAVAARTGTAIRVLRGDGNIVGQTAGAPVLPEPEERPIGTSVGYRVATRTVELSVPGGKRVPLVAQVVRPTAARDRDARRLLLLLTGMVVIATAVTFAAGLPRRRVPRVPFP
jgi:hypothetical protein